MAQLVQDLGRAVAAVGDRFGSAFRSRWRQVIISAGRTQDLLARARQSAGTGQYPTPLAIECVVQSSARG